MNWAQIEEREIKERTAKEIRGKIAKVGEEEWREEMEEKKNSLGIYRRFKEEMKEEDYSGSLESMVWLRARTNSLNLGENSWRSEITKRMLKREKNQLKKDSEKENISGTVIRKKILVKTVIRKNISERMLKTVKTTNAPREGRWVPLQRQNPKNF